MDAKIFVASPGRFKKQPHITVGKIKKGGKIANLLKSI